MRDAVELLSSTELFGALGRAELRALARVLEPMHLPAGSTLFREGEPGDALYLVVHGRLRAARGAGTGAVELDEAGPGAIVGEVAVISDGPRFATVQALRDSDVLRLSSDAFHTLVRRHSDLLLGLAHVLVERLTAPAHAPATTGAQTIAIVPAGHSALATVHGFQRTLAQRLRRYGTVAVLAPGDLGGAPTRAEIAAAVEEAEARHDRVLLVTGHDDGTWARGCLRQSDRILVVAERRAEPQPCPAELVPALARRDLVLLHPKGPGPLYGSARWLEGRSVRTHHQVRGGSVADCDRVARSLVGRSVGLVLGGGGPRGFAHLGAIRALHEAGVPIDAVGGASIGALMGAGLALGLDHDDAVERITTAFTASGALLRPTLPLVSLSSGRRIERLLRAPGSLGDIAMEDALLPWFCVSTSLGRAEVVVHDRGPAWLAVRASIALPGILPPVFSDGDLLVDGGVLDNLPVDVMRRRIDGSIIAVDLESEVEHRDHSPFDPSVSGWRALGHRLHPRRRQSAAPSALQVLLRSKQVGLRSLQRTVLAAHPVELHVRPSLGEVGALDFRAGRRLVDAGYRRMVEVLEEADLSRILPPGAAVR